MGNPDQSAGGAGTPGDGKRLHCYLIVLLVAAAVYAGCMISPPSLMDDVDAVQAQIARNMLTSGDWVTARLDGIPYLEKAPLIYWLIAGSFKIFGATDWAARIPMVLAAIGAGLADHRIWDVGLRPPGRILRGPVHIHVLRPVSIHAHSDSRRDAHREHHAFHVGVPARDR